MKKRVILCGLMTVRPLKAMSVGMKSIVKLFVANCGGIVSNR